MLAACAGIAAPCAGQDPDALANAGTTAIATGRFGDALEAFTKAAEIRPDDATLCFGAGVAAYMLGRDDVARTSFECSLDRNPSFLPAAIWLGDLQYQAGRLPEAIATCETALERSPGSRELHQRLDDWRKQQALQSRFHEARTAHFTALFEADADEPVAREVIQRLEDAYRRIGDTLGVYPYQPITVVLYTREQYDGILKLADWSVAAYDGRIRVPLGAPLEQPGELDRVLSHEFVHALVARLAGRTVPAWVSEGLATVLEPARPDEGEVTLVRTRALPALSELQRGFARLSRGDAEIAYATAASAVRRLIAQRGMTAVVALLEDLGRGTPFPRAFQQRIAMRYEDFAKLVARD